MTLNISTSSALLAAFCTALEGLLESDRVGLQLTSSNRFRPDLSSAVGNLTQTGVLVHQVSGLSFASLATGLSTASIRAYANARYDYVDVTRMIQEVDRRVEGLNVGLIFDDLREDRSPATVTRELVANPKNSGRGSKSRFKWMDGIPHEKSSLILYVLSQGDAYSLYVLFDTAFLSASEIECLMWSMEDIVMREAAQMD